MLAALLFCCSCQLMAQTRLWLTGKAVPGGCVEMTKAPDGSFKYGGKLNAGTLLIATDKVLHAGTQYLKPDDEDAYVINEGVSYTITNSAKNAAWIVPFAEKYYQIHVSPKDNKSGNESGRIHKPWHYTYIAGGATEFGWSQYQMQKMTQDKNNPCIFTWTGKLQDNTKKGYEEPKRIKTQGQLSWSSKAFHAYKQDEDLLSSSQMRYGGEDTKWSINKNGIYKITINTLLETISAQLIRESKDNN